MSSSHSLSRSSSHHSSTPLRLLRYPDWQRPYQAALLSVDPKKLAEHVAETEAAIFKRLQELSDSESQDGHAERQVIQGAIRALWIIERDSLNFPDWESNSLLDREAS
jgi:hypothetical protein